MRGAPDRTALLDQPQEDGQSRASASRRGDVQEAHGLEAGLCLCLAVLGQRGQQGIVVGDGAEGQREEMPRAACSWYQAR